MIWPRIKAAIAVVAAGLAISTSYLWLPGIFALIVSAFIAGIAVSWFAAWRHRSPADREQRQMIQDLWSAAHRLQAGRVLEDPVTGRGLAIERERGFVTLAVADPRRSDDPNERREATVTRYMLGFLGSPIPPPLLRHTAPLDEDVPARMPWRQARGLLRFNDQTGAMETSAGELAELRAQLGRAIAAAGRG